MTPKLPGSLVRYIQEKRCVVFVGAGMSAGAGLPTWGALLEMGIEELGRSVPDGEGHQDELRELVKRGKLLEVAEFCRDKMGAAYHQFLTDKVRGDQAGLPATHDLLMELPFSAWVTTNYDKLLERAYSKVLGGYPRTLTQKDTQSLGQLLFDGGQFILKAHGDIDRPETVVLTSHDYSEIIHANPAFNEAFSGLLLTKALFFVGYSLSDPDFRLLMDRQLTHFKGFVPERFALMMDVGPVERDVLWRTARIRVLSYEKGKHEQVLQFLQALKAAVFPQPVAQAGSPQPQPPVASPVAPPQVVAHNVADTPKTGPSWWKANVWPGSPPTSVPAPAAAPARGPAVVLESFASPQAAQATGRALPLFTLEAELSDSIEEDQPRSETALASARSPDAPQAVPIGPDVLAVEEVGRQLKFRLIRKGQAVAEWISVPVLNRDMWQSLRRVAREGKRGELPVVAYAEFTRVFEKYDGVRRVFDALGEGGTASQELLMLRVPPRLSRFPWELLPIQGQPVCLERKLVRAPIGIPAQARGAPQVRSTPRILLIQGQGGGVAARELERIVRQYQGARGFSCTVLQGEDATFTRVMAELDAELPDLLHYVGGVRRVDGELVLTLSGDVDLSEGALLSVLSRGRLPFLVLNAASSAFAPPAFGWYSTEERSQRMREPGSSSFVFDGFRGFMELATETGVGAFVGAFDLPNAEAGATFMTSLHRDLITGLPIADAVLRARQEVHKKFPGSPTALQYVLSGDGELQLWDSRRE